MLAVLKPMIDKQQLETAHRLHAEISSIFVYAIVHNFTDYDPAQPVAKQIDERRKMMQAWADYLEGLKAGVQVIPFRKQGEIA